MDHSNGQKRWMRSEDDHVGALPTQIPRPRNGAAARIPVQLAAPPRTHQYHRPGPGNPYSRQAVQRYPDRSNKTDDVPPRSPHRPSHTHGQQTEHPRPPVSYQPPGRHYSHISALSTSQADLDSRPVSEITAVPTFASKAVSEVDEEEEHDFPLPATHSRGGSQGRRTKTTTPVTRSRKNSVPVRESETLPSGDQATMEALTAAIRQGLSPTATSSRSATPKPFSEVAAFRMPFQGEPSSPSSVYTDTTATNRRFSIPISSYQGYDPRDSKPSTIAEQDASDYERSGYAQDLPTPMSTHPIMSGEPVGMSSKIAAGRRPPKLDIGAVREAEARGSITSLSDLIKRATRLASNLDRGRTASRLGHLDMFGGSSDKLGNNNVRASTYSDVLNAFPPPAEGTTTPGGGRPNTMWPNGEKQYMTSKSSLGRFVDNNENNEKAKRKCCGMSPPIFVLVLVIVFLLVAAAVLVPIFLIVLPRQHSDKVDAATCPSSHPCQHGGFSVFTGKVCSCICVDGFTGDDCSSERDPECLTSSITDGGTTYDNATVGSSVLSLLQSAQKPFNIPLNTTTILSEFAYNNLSCASENSLVDFGIDRSSARVKRFVIVPGMMSTEPHVPALNLPPSESKEHPRFVIVDGLQDSEEELHLLPTHTFEARQDATQSANGIVFATSSDTVSSPTATATGAATNSDSSTATTSSSKPSQTGNMNATDEQLDFGAMVVLYVLQMSSDISNAVAANQAILAHFQGSTSNSTVQVISGSDGMQANFDDLRIMFANGTVVGGQ